MNDPTLLPPVIERLRELMEAGEVPATVEISGELLLEAIAHVAAFQHVTHQLKGDESAVSIGCGELVAELMHLLWEPPDDDREWATHPLQVTYWSRGDELAGHFFAELAWSVATDGPISDATDLRAESQACLRRTEDMRARGTVDPRLAPVTS